MKTILVTGGNRGIGLEICRQLDEMGHQVILGSRDFEKGIQAAVLLSKNVTVKQLDITNEDSINQLADYVRSEYGKLDVLINNAGIGEKSFGQKEPLIIRVKNKIEKNIYGVRQLNRAIMPALRKTGLVAERKTAGNIPLDHVRYIMETNLYGAWLMIQAFIPLLEKSEEGRIINMSSGMGELAGLSGSYPAYRMSKAALNALTIMFSRELNDKGIKVNAMCPGWVKTDMGGPNAPREVSQGADTAVWLATEEKIPTGKFFRDRKEINW